MPTYTFYLSESECELLAKKFKKAVVTRDLLKEIILKEIKNKK